MPFIVVYPARILAIFMVIVVTIIKSSKIIKNLHFRDENCFKNRSHATDRSEIKISQANRIEVDNNS